MTVNISITTPRSLYAYLKNRETHGCKDAKTELPKILSRRITENISLDRFFSYQVNVGLCSLIARKGNWIAFAHNHCISLYDLLARKVMWKCEVPMEADHALIHLEISDRGHVHIFSQSKLPCRTLQTIDQGRIVDEAEVLSDFESTKLLSTFAPNDEQVEAINTKAEAIIRASRKASFETRERKAVFTQEYYVLMTIRASITLLHTQAFVFDHDTKIERVFDLETSQTIKEIPCAMIHNNHLFYASNNRRTATQTWTPYDSIITVMNLMTGEKVKTYESGHLNGRIYRCIVSEDYIVYLSESRPMDNALWCINRHTGSHRLLFPFFGSSSYLSFTSNFLNVTFESNGVDRLKTVDLSNGNIIKHVQYHWPFLNKLSFEEGTLVVINRNNPNRPTFYVEDYLNPEGDSSLSHSPGIARVLKQ